MLFSLFGMNEMPLGHAPLLFAARARSQCADSLLVFHKPAQ